MIQTHSGEGQVVLVRNTLTTQLWTTSVNLVKKITDFKGHYRIFFHFNITIQPLFKRLSVLYTCIILNPDFPKVSLFLNLYLYSL
jgi:hypothetical protein